MPGLSPISNMASEYLQSGRPISWPNCLKCTICDDFFRKPRILPCGHTFCSDCLDELRDGIIKAGKSSPVYSPIYNSCFPDPNGAYGSGLILTCPEPDCQYSMKLMNLSRWALRNKVIQTAVGGYKRYRKELKDASTQTNIGMESALVAIPRTIIPTLRKARQENGLDSPDGNNQTSFTLGGILQKALSMDSLNQNYVPSELTSWKSCAALLGANILEQLIHI